MSLLAIAFTLIYHLNPFLDSLVYYHITNVPVGSLINQHLSNLFSQVKPQVQLFELISTWPSFCGRLLWDIWMPFVEHNSNRMSGILVDQFSCHNSSFLVGWNMTLLRVALGMNLDRTVETFASIYYRWNKKFTPSIHWSRYPVSHSQTSSFHKIIYYCA